MSSQLEQLLGYLERDGVTEVLFGSGRPIAMRNARGLTNITARPLSADQLMNLLRGSEITVLIPTEDGEGPPGAISVGRRRGMARVARRGDELVVSLTRFEAPAPVATQPLARVASPPEAAPSAAPGQAASAAPAPAPSSAPTPAPAPARAPSPAPAPTQALPVEPSVTFKPRTTTATGGLRQVAPAAPAMRAPAMRAPAPAAPAPAENAFDSLSLDDDGGIELEAPQYGSASSRPAPQPAGAALDLELELPPPRSQSKARGDEGISLGNLDGLGELTLDTGPAPAAPAPVTGLSAAGPTRAKSPSATPYASGLAAAGGARSGSANNPPYASGLAAAGTARSGTPSSQPFSSGLSAAGIVAPTPAPAPGSFASGLSAAGSVAAKPAAPSAFGAHARSARPSSAPALGGTFGALVQAARDAGASDLHIAAARVTSIRALGELVPLVTGSPPLTAAAAEELLLPLIRDPALRAQLDSVGYVDFAVDAPGGGRLRANISRQQQGLKGTFRLALAAPATLEDLGLPADLAKIVAHHQGLVVVSGPSGQGKTTTLAALVDLLNSSRPYHILSIEDPVEIIHPRKHSVISQREAGRHTASFARGLKASLREDPDVIVIGELRDRESVEIALTAAETGHLVIATMSTPSAAKTIDRLIDMFPPEEHSQVRASIAGALRAIVAQRLLPRIGGGIVPAIELVTGVVPLAVLIRDDKLFQLPNLMQRGRAFGMIRFDESLAEHVRAGRIDEEVALNAAESRKDLAAVLHPAGTLPGGQPKTSPLWGFGKKEQK